MVVKAVMVRRVTSLWHCPHHSSVLFPNPWQAEGLTRLHTLLSKSNGNEHFQQLFGTSRL